MGNASAVIGWNITSFHQSVKLHRYRNYCARDLRNIIFDLGGDIMLDLAIVSLEFFSIFSSSNIMQNPVPMPLHHSGCSKRQKRGIRNVLLAI